MPGKRYPDPVTPPGGARLAGSPSDALAREIDLRGEHDPRVDVLCQIYGIGRSLGVLIVAEIGAIERFPSARHLCAWAGLTPTVRSSDAKARLGHISGLGSGPAPWTAVLSGGAGRTATLGILTRSELS